MEENREKQIPIVQSRQDDEIEIDLKEIFYLLLSHWKSIFHSKLIRAAIFGAYHTFFLKLFRPAALSGADRRLCEHHQEPYSAEPRH